MTTAYPSLETHPGNDPTYPAFWDALRDVMDPEIPISVVDLGLIVAMTEHDGVVEIKLTFTAMGCPAMEFSMNSKTASAPNRREALNETHVWQVYAR